MWCTAVTENGTKSILVESVQRGRNTSIKRVLCAHYIQQQCKHQRNIILEHLLTSLALIFAKDFRHTHTPSHGNVISFDAIMHTSAKTFASFDVLIFRIVTSQSNSETKNICTIDNFHGVQMAIKIHVIIQALNRFEILYPSHKINK